MTALSLSDLRAHVFPKSLRILQRLIDANGAMVTFRDLIAEAWPGSRDANPMNLRTAVHNIRQSLEGTGWTVSVVRGLGYRLERKS